MLENITLQKVSPTAREILERFRIDNLPVGERQFSLEEKRYILECARAGIDYKVMSELLGVNDPKRVRLCKNNLLHRGEPKQSSSALTKSERDKKRVVIEEGIRNARDLKASYGLPNARVDNRELTNKEREYIASCYDMGIPYKAVVRVLGISKPNRIKCLYYRFDKKQSLS